MSADPILHLVQKSPFSCSALSDCLSSCRAVDSIVLMHDAAYAGTQLPDAQYGSVYVLTEEAEARGITNRLDARVQLIDYTGLVELCAQFKHNQSWF